MSKFGGKEVPIMITMIVGFIVIIDYFLTIPQIAFVSSFLSTNAVVLVAFALGLGAATMVRVHVPVVQRRTPGRWLFSLWLLFVAGITGALGVFGGIKNPGFDWIFNYVFTPLGATIFSLLGFYVVSAAYRAFRARSLESGVLLVAAALVMLMNAPIGQVIWAGFPVIGTWVRDIPGLAGQRGTAIALAVGVSVFSLRVLLGLERRGREV